MDTTRCSSTVSGQSLAPSVDGTLPFPSAAEFIAWLEADPDAQAGWPRSPYACPIARFLNQHYDIDTAYVRPDPLANTSFWRVSDDGSNRQSLPEWANEFGKAVDLHGRLQISARDCLRIIKEIAPPTGPASPGSAPNTDAPRQNDITTGTASDNYFQQMHDSDKAWAERNGGQRERE